MPSSIGAMRVVFIAMCLSVLACQPVSAPSPSCAEVTASIAAPGSTVTKLAPLCDFVRRDLHVSVRYAGNNDEARRFASDLVGQDPVASLPARLYVHLTSPLGQPSTPANVTVVGIWLVQPGIILSSDGRMDEVLSRRMDVVLQQLTSASGYYPKAFAYAVLSDESLQPIQAAFKDGRAGGGAWFR